MKKKVREGVEVDMQLLKEETDEENWKVSKVGKSARIIYCKKYSIQKEKEDRMDENKVTLQQ